MFAGAVEQAFALGAHDASEDQWVVHAFDHPARGGCDDAGRLQHDAHVQDPRVAKARGRHVQGRRGALARRFDIAEITHVQQERARPAGAEQAGPRAQVLQALQRQAAGFVQEDRPHRRHVAAGVLEDAEQGAVGGRGVQGRLVQDIEGVVEARVAAQAFVFGFRDDQVAVPGVQRRQVGAVQVALRRSEVFFGHGKVSLTPSPVRPGERLCKTIP